MTENKNLRTEEDKHTAMPPVAGIIYQFNFFLYKLLTISKGEQVSFEKYDDTANKNENGITFYQLKHSIKAALFNENVNLTDRSPELWKTLDVWRKIVIGGDEKSKQKQEIDQEKFINDNNFVLVTNKNIDNNKLIKLCDYLCENSDENNVYTDSILDDISNQGRTNNKNSKEGKRTVQSYIDNFRSFKYNKLLLSKISFESESFEGIKEKCLEHIHLQIKFPEEQAQAVFDDLSIEVRKDLEDCAKNGIPLVYDFDKQLKRFQGVYSIHRGNPINFKIKTEPFNNNFLDLVCIKQLSVVNDIKKSQTDKIAKIVSEFLSFKNKYSELKENNFLIESDIDNFEGDAIQLWDNEFGDSYIDIGTNTEDVVISKCAHKLLYNIRKNNLKLRDSNLGIQISNGAYYYFSDECKIGWHLNWEKYFKKQEK